MSLRTVVILAVLGGALAACSSAGPSAGPSTTPAPSTAATSPATSSAPVAATPAHTVVVVMENHSYAEVIGNPQAPYINQLARSGALFTHSRAITHPSQPNYLALFSGSTQGVTGDSCPHRFTAANLGSQLIAAGRTFTGYAEGLPAAGSQVCNTGEYARRHVPWADFANVPAADSQPFTSFPASDYARLPTVSFVIPNVCHDMHNCSVATGDAWLRTHLGGYASWAMTHRSLLIVTWDENDGSAGNGIPTIFVGQQVRPGRYSQPITHYSVLRTLENLYQLPVVGAAASVHVITGTWS